MAAVGLAIAAFVAMEPFTAAVHRFVMHGPAWRWHASHHQPSGGGWEANDVFPAVFAALVVGAMVVGYHVPGLGALVPIGAGITVYGASYAFVHDVCIHRRWGPQPRLPGVERLVAAHRVHHRDGAAPYGMLLPLAPRGSRPSHVPVEANGWKRANSSSPYQASARVRRTTSAWRGRP